MRNFTALFLFVFVFCGYSLYANGEFIRGDANGDGTLSITDVSVIGQMANGSLTSTDAGDVNDNGVVDAADAAMLYNYLFSSGPEPVYPFPSSDVECTGDSLSNCYSPPDSPSSPYWGPFYYVDFVTNSWTDEGLSSHDPVEGIQVTSRNSEGCSDGYALSGWTATQSYLDSTGLAYTDTSGFSAGRLNNGVQQASLIVTVSTTFDAQYACECPKTSEMSVHVGSVTVVTSLGTITVNGTWTETDYTYDYISVSTSGGGCSVVGQNSNMRTFIFIASLTDQLATLGSECDIGTIKEVSLYGEHEFVPTGGDATEDERITSFVDVYLSYTWCN